MRDESIAYEACTFISEGRVLANSRRVRRFTDQQCFKTRAKMAALFAHLKGVLQNTVEVAKRNNLTLVLGKPKPPLFPTSGGMSLKDYPVAASWPRRAAAGAVP